MGFNAKWTGFRITDLLNQSGLKTGANYVFFTSADGCSTSLPLEYIRQNKILIAYGINDMTLPQDRGFPLQVVAKGKYDYKWAKWITRIEVAERDISKDIGNRKATAIVQMSANLLSVFSCFMKHLFAPWKST